MAGHDMIAKTSNGGRSWEIIYEQGNRSPEIINFQFLSNELGYVTMERGKIMKTTDGGDTWNNKFTTSVGDLNDLYFVHADSGVVVGEDGRILTTSDGGENFTTNYTVTSKTLNAIHITDESNGWIVEEKGVLLTSNAGDVYTSIEGPAVTELPSKIELHQNYPNPFNPSTTIRYQISSNNLVSLKIYDTLGRQVATLVNEYKPAGEHVVSFNAPNLSSGMYIYQLKAGNAVITKKLILIK